MQVCQLKIIVINYTPNFFSFNLNSTIQPLIVERKVSTKRTYSEHFSVYGGNRYVLLGTSYLKKKVKRSVGRNNQCGELFQAESIMWLNSTIQPLNVMIIVYIYGKVVIENKLFRHRNLRNVTLNNSLLGNIIIYFHSLKAHEKGFARTLSYNY